MSVFTYILIGAGESLLEYHNGGIGSSYFENTMEIRIESNQRESTQYYLPTNYRRIQKTHFFPPRFSNIYRYGIDIDVYIAIQTDISYR